MPLFEFQIPAHIGQMTVIQGLVVPVGTIVTKGLVMPKMPTNESAIASLKLLFGIKKHKKIIEEDESPVRSIKSECSSVDSEISASESEAPESDDD